MLTSPSQYAPADEGQPAELDPLGSDTGTSNPYLNPITNPDEGNNSVLSYPSFSDPRHLGTTYSMFGITVTADFALGLLETHAVEINTTSPSASAPNIPGTIPIYGRFCVGVGNGPLDCTNEITGYTTHSLGAEVTPLPIEPQESENQRNFREAVDTTRQILQGDNDCTRFLEAQA